MSGAPTELVSGRRVIRGLTAGAVNPRTSDADPCQPIVTRPSLSASVPGAAAVGMKAFDGAPVAPS